MWSRRAVLAGGGVALLGAAAAGVADGVLPGRTFVRHELGLDGADGSVPDVEPGPLRSGAFSSRARGGRRTGWTIAWPPHARVGASLPVAVVLHGRRNDHTTAFGGRHLGLDRFLAQAVHGGATPFAIASVDGGSAYWHDRRDGDGAATMVVEEFLPLLASHGLDVARLALMGWSMGGFGSLHLAGVLGHARVSAVAAMSPALWHRFADTAPGAFDDAADFARTTDFGRQHRLDGVRVRIDCGRDDPFFSATRDYVAGFANRPAGGFEPGAHTMGYWRRLAPTQVRFVAEALT
ncbi:alpha/beta hydrolase [Nocardioides mangrovicus]|uniref:alpha/beta hydrolase n=1 Tax=Nocardioides mangrovicus TaxID=2478913 RepID=UPI001E2D7B2D|nr:alpha/beta hydrolase-fold protein [Nocardioides mangrovicus]